MYYFKSYDYKTHSLIPFIYPLFPRITTLGADIVGTLTVGDNIVFSMTDRGEGGSATVRADVAKKSNRMRERLDYIMDSFNNYIVKGDGHPVQDHVIDLMVISDAFDRKEED